jgi:hypothetical protein
LACKRYGRGVASETIAVLDAGRRLEFTFAAMLAYHGPGSPGGAAHAFKVMQRAFPLLTPDGVPERRELVFETAFAGPGARDGIELVTRAVSDGRYHLVAELARPERGVTLERFVFRVRYGDLAVTLAVREGFVPNELVALARLPERTPAQEERLTAVKYAMAEQVMGAAAADVYEIG